MEARERRRQNMIEKQEQEYQEYLKNIHKKRYEKQQVIILLIYICSQFLVDIDLMKFMNLIGFLKCSLHFLVFLSFYFGTCGSEIWFGVTNIHHS